MNHKVQDYRLRRNVGFALIGIVMTWLIFTFLLYPNISLLKVTMAPTGTLDLKPVSQIMHSARVIKALKNSLLLAVCLTMTVAVLGVFEILSLDYFDIKGYKWLNIAYHSPLVCNGMVLVTAYNFMFGSQGFVTANLMKMYPDISPVWFRGFGAVLIEMTFAGTSNYVMIVRDALRNIDYQTIEAAQNMGIKSNRILTKVVLPVLKPSVFAAAILTFITGVSAFATPQVLGGEHFETINPLVMAFSRTLTTRNYAAVLALFLGLITIIVLIISNYIERKGNYMSVSKVKTPLKKQKIKNPVINAIVTVVAHIFALVHTIPLLFVLIFSLMPVQDLYAGRIDFKNMTLKNYSAAFNSTSGVRPIITSVIYSICASLIVVAIMLFITRLITKYHNKITGALELSLNVPWFLPSTLIALGLVMAFDGPRAMTFGRTLTGTAYIMLIGYIIIKLPYTLRMIKAAYSGLDGALEEAAKNLGASSYSTYFQVLLPVIWPAVLSVLLLNFIGLLSEYNVSAFLFHPMYQPLGVVLNAATGLDATPEAQMLTFVYSVLIMIVSIIAISIVSNSKAAAKNRKK